MTPPGNKLCVVCGTVYGDETAGPCPNDGAELVIAAAARDDDQVLGMVVGDYRVIREIGKSAASTVWEAEHVRSRHKRVVKVLEPSQLAAESVARGLDDARRTGELGHPNIVAVEAVSAAGDRPHVVMELLEGRDLGRVIAEEGTLPVERVSEIGLQAVEALCAAAQQGVTHGAIGPGNVFLAQGDGGAEVVKLLDFGTARLRGRDVEQGADEAGDVRALATLLHGVLTGAGGVRTGGKEGEDPSAGVRRSAMEAALLRFMTPGAEVPSTAGLRAALLAVGDDAAEPVADPTAELAAEPVAEPSTAASPAPSPAGKRDSVDAEASTSSALKWLLIALLLLAAAAAILYFFGLSPL